jgi:pyruvate dehydrogenase E2 component (dihydrolipoamide acetyltransferase)
MQEFKLPDLGEGMQEAEIRRWLIHPGDTVKLDQPMVEVETDKAVVEIPSPVAARVTDIRVQEGKVAKLGEVLVTFETATKETASTPQGSASPTITSSPIASESALPATNGVSSTTTRRVLAAPAVRKRAFELGIDLANVSSSHPSGRVTMDDIQSYTEHVHNVGTNGANGANASQDTALVRKTEPVNIPRVENTSSRIEPSTSVTTPIASPNRDETEERQPLVGLRRRIAERMERSWRTIPHATSFDETDGTELASLRATLKPLAEQRGVRLTYMPLLVKLLLPVLKEFPIFNASMDEERREIIYKRSYHIGIATDTPEGLLVPVLRDADKLTILQIAQQLEHLIEASQKRSLTMQEVAGSTFTLNNVGSFGGGTGTPIINYPEAAILAVGRLQEKAMVQNGTVIVRTMMPLAMSFDHRLIDGALAGKFLTRFRELVEYPQQLLLDML